MTRTLASLDGIGKAMMADFKTLGISSVEQLAREDGDALYHRLCAVTGSTHDVCVLDTLRCAVAQARDAELPAEQRNWWYWSRMRKAGK